MFGWLIGAFMHNHGIDRRIIRGAIKCRLYFLAGMDVNR